MPGSATIGIGEEHTLTATVSHGGPVAANVAWNATPVGVVGLSVPAGGGSCTVTGLAAGVATVTAFIPGAGVQDTFTVTVQVPSPDTISISG